MVAMCCPAVSALPLCLISPVSCSSCPNHPHEFKWSQLAVAFVVGFMTHHTDALPHCGHGTLRTWSPAILPPNASPNSRRRCGLVRTCSLSCLSCTAALRRRGGGGAALRASMRALRALYSFSALPMAHTCPKTPPACLWVSTIQHVGANCLSAQPAHRICGRGLCMPDQWS